MTLTSAQLCTMHDTIYFHYPNLIFRIKCHLALSTSSPCCKDTHATHKHCLLDRLWGSKLHIHMVGRSGSFIPSTTEKFATKYFCLFFSIYPSVNSLPAPATSPSLHEPVIITQSLEFTQKFHSKSENWLQYLEGGAKNSSRKHFLFFFLYEERDLRPEVLLC